MIPHGCFFDVSPNLSFVPSPPATSTTVKSFFYLYIAFNGFDPNVSSCKDSQTVTIPVMQINICVAWGLLAIFYVQVPVTLNRILFPEEVHHGNIPCAWYSRFTKSLKSTKGFLINCRTTLLPIPHDMLACRHLPPWQHPSWSDFLWILHGSYRQGGRALRHLIWRRYDGRILHP